MRSLSEFMSKTVSDYIYEEDKKFLAFKYCEMASPQDLAKLDPSAKVILLCLESDLLFGVNFPFFEKFFKNNKKNSIVFIERYPKGFSKESRNIAKHKQIPSELVRLMTEEDKEEEFNEENLDQKMLDNDASTHIGSVITGRNGEVSDSKAGSHMAIEDIPEKEMMFSIENGFFQFALDDHTISKNEYGVVNSILTRPWMKL